MRYAEDSNSTMITCRRKRRCIITHPLPSQEMSRKSPNQNAARKPGAGRGDGLLSWGRCLADGQESAENEVVKRGEKLTRIERKRNTAKILEAVLWRDPLAFDTL